MKRKTEERLEMLLNRINHMMGRPEDGWREDENGKAHQNKGHLALDTYAPGPRNPYHHKIVEFDENGIWDFSGHDRMTDAECEAWLQGFLRALDNVINDR